MDNFAAGILPVLPVGILNVCCFILIADIGTVVHFCLPPIIPLCALDLSEAIISAFREVLPPSLPPVTQDCLPPSLLTVYRIACHQHCCLMSACRHPFCLISSSTRLHPYCFLSSSAYYNLRCLLHSSPCDNPQCLFYSSACHHPNSLLSSSVCQHLRRLFLQICLTAPWLPFI